MRLRSAAGLEQASSWSISFQLEQFLSGGQRVSDGFFAPHILARFQRAAVQSLVLLAPT